jgi:hypothetical protein
MASRLAGAALIVVATLWGAPPGGADVEGAVCQTDWVATLTVPMGPDQSLGRYDTGGETGVIRCDGSIRGRQVTGEGTYGELGAYGPGPQGGADCSKGAGSGDFTATIPTEDGPQHISGPVTFYWMGPGGVLTGGFAGTFQLSYPSSNCFTAPAPKMHIQARGLLIAGGG